MTVVIEQPRDTPTITTDPVSQLLWDAADLLERNGWCQREFEDEQGRHCLVGAINRAPSPGVYSLELEIQRLSATGYMQTFLGMEPMRWNDMHGRTKEEVVSALRRASEEA
jgi:hypothetical protein